MVDFWWNFSQIEIIKKPTTHTTKKGEIFTDIMDNIVIVWKLERFCPNHSTLKGCTSEVVDHTFEKFVEWLTNT